MDNCHSGDHIAGDHIHTDIITCNTEDIRCTAFERSVKDYWDYWGRRGPKHVLLDLKPQLCFSMGSKPMVRVKVPKLINESTQVTKMDKTYDEEMRTRQK